MGWLWRALAAVLATGLASVAHAALVSLLAFVMVLPTIILVAVASNVEPGVTRYAWYGGYAVAAVAGLVALILGPPRRRARRTRERYWNICRACGETFRVTDPRCPFCGHAVESDEPT